MVAKSKPQGEGPFDKPAAPKRRGKKTVVDPVAERMSEASDPSVVAPVPLRTTVVGAFAERTHAQEAVNELRVAGFGEDEIGLIARDQHGGSLGAHEVEHLEIDETEGMAEGAVAGSLTGAGLAGLWAIGISSGVLPAIGPAIAGGILVSVLTSAVAGAAVGGIVGSLVGLGLSEEDALHYERAFHSGQTIVTVRSPGRTEEAAQILERFGGVTDSASMQSVSDTGEPASPAV